MDHTILIVDDSPTARRYVRSELERLGHCVIEAVDGPSALRVLAERLPALGSSARVRTGAGST